MSDTALTLAPATAWYGYFRTGGHWQRMAGPCASIDEAQLALWAELRKQRLRGGPLDVCLAYGSDPPPDGGPTAMRRPASAKVKPPEVTP